MEELDPLVAYPRVGQHASSVQVTRLDKIRARHRVERLVRKVLEEFGA
jgi:hypothetical protein